MLATAVTLGLLLSAIGAGVTMAKQTISCDPAGCSIMPWPGSLANKEAYWEAYFGGMECTKVNESGDFTTTEDHDVIIVKAGKLNFVWQPGLAATYSTSPAVSHWFYCDGTVADQVIDPTGSLEGPCADPAYYAIFDNTASTVFIKFRFRWYNNHGLNAAVKWVPGGSKFITWQHWAKPGTYASVWWKDPIDGSWHLLDRELVIKGSYPPCEYDPGWYQLT